MREYEIRDDYKSLKLIKRKRKTEERHPVYHHYDCFSKIYNFFFVKYNQNIYIYNLKITRNFALYQTSTEEASFVKLEKRLEIFEETVNGPPLSSPPISGKIGR